MTREEIETCRRDPKNRKWGILYYCRADPRVIVPKRPRWMGWTANFAHPAAIPVTLLLIALVAAPPFIAIALGAAPGLAVATGVAAITAVCLVCAWLSSRTS